jgi:ubiquinone/menaquinone biosynthesis C-methylase UbiE
MDNKQLSNKDIISNYDRIYSGSGLRANSAYYRWLLKLLNPKPNIRLLDVACGEGIFLREFSKSVKGARVCGLDISDKALLKAKVNVPFGDLVNGDGQHLPFMDEEFDYVTCLGGLEHYLDPEKGMHELCRVGKKDAFFCIVLPNSVSIDFLQYVVKNGAKPLEDFQIVERKATRKEWEELLQKNGFEVIKVYGSNVWPELFQEGTLKAKSIAKYIKFKLIKVFCPVNLAREFVFICKKINYDLFQNKE